MKLLRACALCAGFFLSGCSPRLDPVRERVHIGARNELNRQLQRSGHAPGTCTRVHLVEVGANSYRGLAYFTDGSKGGIAVTVDAATGKVSVKNQ